MTLILYLALLISPQLSLLVKCIGSIIYVFDGYC